MVKEKTQLQEIHYLVPDLDLGVKVTGNAVQYPLNYVNYASVKLEVARFNC